METLIGFFLGTFSSIVGWWFIRKFLAPKIKFADKICKVKAGIEGVDRFVMAFENLRKRKLVDINVKVLVLIPYIFPDLPNVKQVVYLNTSSNYISLVNANKLNKQTKRISNRILFKILPKNEEFDRLIYPGSLRNKNKEGTITLEDIFAINPYVKLNFIVFGYDEFSNVRKTFISKDFKVEDVITGFFKENSIETMEY